MTGSLRDALTQFLDGWRDDLSPAWQHLLGDAAPALSAVPTTLQYDPEAAPIRPSRGVRHRFERDDAHTFLALRAVEPHAVRVVIVGQDPYPTLGSATGRSFDDGRLRTWDEPGRAPAMSLKRIVQVLAVARTGDPTWAAPDGWKRLVAAARAGRRRPARAPRAVRPPRRPGGAVPERRADDHRVRPAGAACAHRAVAPGGGARAARAGRVRSAPGVRAVGRGRPGGVRRRGRPGGRARVRGGRSAPDGARGAAAVPGRRQPVRRGQPRPAVGGRTTRRLVTRRRRTRGVHAAERCR
jgi:hypothetical protein